MTDRKLTVSEAITLADIIRACQSNAKVGWLDEHAHGGVATGTMRSIGDQNGAFATGDDDVRDCYVRITLATGFEHFPTMADVLAKVQTGDMVLNYS